jgi:hypothetical protein
MPHNPRTRLFHSGRIPTQQGDRGSGTYSYGTDVNGTSLGTGDSFLKATSPCYIAITAYVR